MAVNTIVFKLLSIAALICAVGVEAQDGPFAGANVLGRQLSLRVVVTDEGPIRADVLLRNASDATITFNGTGRYYDLGWIVSSEGHEVPRRVPKDREEALLWRAEETLSLRPITLEPKAIKEYSVDLRKLYDFLPENEYVITAVFRYFDEKEEIVEVKSGHAVIRTSANAMTNIDSAAALPLRTAPRAIKGANHNTEAIPAVSVPGRINGNAPVSAEDTPVSKVQTIGADSSIGFTTTRKVALALSTALLALVLAILWLASRRKPEA